MKPLTPATPHVIFMAGIPSAGKSTFAEQLAKTFQAPLISLEAIAKHGQVDSYTAERITGHVLDEIFKTKRTVIYDGYTDTQIARQELVQKSKKAGYQPLLVWVQTESLEARRRATKPRRDHSQLTDEEFDEIVDHFVPPTAKEKPVVISGRHTYSSQLKVVLKHVAREPQRAVPVPPRPQPPQRNIILR